VDDGTPERAALDQIFRLLARRAHGRAELRRKARQRGHESAHIQAAIERAEELGVLEPDSVSAAQFARERARRAGATPRQVEAKLRERGYETDLARRAARDAFSDWDPRAAAQEVTKSERDPARAARKLQRLGFPTDVIREVVSRLRPENDDDETA